MRAGPAAWAGVLSLFILLAATADALLVPGTLETDLLAAAEYDWSLLPGRPAGVADLEGMPRDAALPRLAARVDAHLGALEAVHATIGEDGVLAPVFQLGIRPIQIEFDPPLPIGDGLHRIEPERLAWNESRVEPTGDAARLVLATHAWVPRPENGTSPPQGGEQNETETVLVSWRVDVAAQLSQDPHAGLRSPAAVRSVWAVILPEGGNGAYNVTWTFLFESRTQNQGALQRAGEGDGFDGVYLERGEHRAAFRHLLRTAVPVSSERFDAGPQRTWRVVDPLHGPLPEGERVLLPQTLLVTTTAPTPADVTFADGVAFELGFYQLADPGAAPPPAAPKPPTHRLVPALWQVALGLAALAALVFPWRGGRGGATASPGPAGPGGSP